MIPKRAIFYWSGPEMSWLRWQSIETFRKHNPEWEVALIGPDENEPEWRKRVIRSDYERYKELAARGGMYFDTDILFVAPVPDEWLTKDNCMVAHDGAAQGIACLGSKPGSNLFASLVQDCEERMKSKVLLAYQSLGIKLFVGRDVRRMAAAFGETLYQIQIETLFPCPWSGVERLWSPITWARPANAVGVHWFGGDDISREFEPKITPETLDDHPCLITEILKQQVAA